MKKKQSTLSCKTLLKHIWLSPYFSEVHFQVWWALQEPTCPCVCVCVITSVPCTNECYLVAVGSRE